MGIMGKTWYSLQLSPSSNIPSFHFSNFPFFNLSLLISLF
ncbi:hypothetical protein ASZ90_004321 [hydrocarbon metagenome]|uniref:Uncharacterized protein n=1 Tax=hydrocarbon metagenome TaxID=938273 RepID=A0A0W8FY41_9ZZZZ